MLRTLDFVVKTSLSTNVPCKTSGKRNPVAWWSGDVESDRKSYIRSRRKLAGMRRRGVVPDQLVFAVEEVRREK